MTKLFVRKRIFCLKQSKLFIILQWQLQFPFHRQYTNLPLPCVLQSSSMHKLRSLVLGSHLHQLDDLRIIRILFLLRLVMIRQKMLCVWQLPRAIAPPWILIFVSSMFSSLFTDKETAANASFNSYKSTSSFDHPAFFSWTKTKLKKPVQWKSV